MRRALRVFWLNHLSYVFFAMQRQGKTERGRQREKWGRERGEREREREGGRDIQTDRQTDRQTDT